MSGSLLHRYQNGDYLRVWEELTQLGPAARDPQYFADATAVARETMKRARHNVEQIIEKLDRLGFWSTKGPSSLKNPWVFRPADPHASQHLDALEEIIGGPLPLSIRHWWEQIEFVCLTGAHEALTPCLVNFLSERTDFDVDAPEPLVIWAYDLENLTDLAGFNEPGFQLQIERDAYAIRLPDASADVKLRPDGTWFVPYLRKVFEWAGFPGWAHLESWLEPAREKFPVPPKELDHLRDGLLPI